MEKQQQEWKNTTSHSKAYWATVRGPWWRLAPASPWSIPRDGHGKVEREGLPGSSEEQQRLQTGVALWRDGWRSGVGLSTAVTLLKIQEQVTLVSVGLSVPARKRAGGNVLELIQVWC